MARATVRRALVSAWQQAGAWGLAPDRRPARSAPTAGGSTLEESADLLVETFPRTGGADSPAELCIVVERQEDRDAVEAIVRRTA